MRQLKDKLKKISVFFKDILIKHKIVVAKRNMKNELYLVFLFLSLAENCMTSLKIIRQFNQTTHTLPTTFIARQHHRELTSGPLQYSSTEEKLLEYLFKNYNPNIIPRESSNESLKLYIGLAMVQLINIVKPQKKRIKKEVLLKLKIFEKEDLIKFNFFKYDKEQVMKTNVWIHMVRRCQASFIEPC